jgi:hypothetical protein
VLVSFGPATILPPERKKELLAREGSQPLHGGYGQETCVITTNRNTDSWTRYESRPQAESLVSRAQTLKTNHRLEFCLLNVLISGFEMLVVQQSTKWRTIERIGSTHKRTAKCILLLIAEGPNIRVSHFHSRQAGMGTTEKYTELQQ